RGLRRDHDRAVPEREGIAAGFLRLHRIAPEGLEMAVVDRDLPGGHVPGRVGIRKAHAGRVRVRAIQTEVAGITVELAGCDPGAAAPIRQVQILPMDQYRLVRINLEGVVDRAYVNAAHGDLIDLIVGARHGTDPNAGRRSSGGGGGPIDPEIFEDRPLKGCARLVLSLEHESHPGETVAGWVGGAGERESQV